jgi:hypothetical protein
MMVRILIDSSVDDCSAADDMVAEAVRRAVQPLAQRYWLAVDHSQPEHARALWRAIEANEDPNRPGKAAIYPTPTKPL